MNTTIANARKACSIAVLSLALVACACLLAPMQAQAQELAAGTPAKAAQTPTADQVKSAVATKAAKAKSKVHKVRTAAQWHYIGLYKGGTFKVMKNIKLPSTQYYLTISKAKKYTIDLNGKKVATTYSGTAKRSAPLTVAKGTVTIKSSKKNKGVLYSTECACVDVKNRAKLYLKSGCLYDDYLDFRDDSTGSVFVEGKAQCHLNGGQVIGSTNGVVAMGNAKIFTTGAGTSTYPYIRAGAHSTNIQFTHYGSAICIASSNARLSLKGGSFGTKATPDMPVYSVVGTYYYTQSGHYPVLDIYGKALKQAAGYKYVDPSGSDVPVREDAVNSTYAGLSPKKMLESWTTDGSGYYAVYVVKA